MGRLARTSHDENRPPLLQPENGSEQSAMTGRRAESCLKPSITVAFDSVNDVRATSTTTPTSESSKSTPASTAGGRVTSGPPPQSPSDLSSGSPSEAERVYSSLMQTVSSVFYSGTPMQQRLCHTSDTMGRGRAFSYGFTQGQPGRPLVFVIPGFGCPHDEQTALYLSQTISDRGFHVATLHSPSHPNFLINSHHSGVPGVTSEDARDALLGITAIRTQLQAEGLNFAASHLVGYSMGALNAAFVRHLDRTGANLIEKVVLINSPVDLAYGMKQLDLFLDARRMSKVAKAALAAKVGVFILLLNRSGLKKSLQMKMFLANECWSESELRALIGFSFEKTVAGGVEAAVRLGFMKQSETVSSFTDFCETATVANYQKFYPGTSAAEFFHSESLLKIAPEITADRNVSLLHNEDDFLLRPSDVAWMRRQFGSSLHLFQSGGHLGNVWRDEFKLKLEESLASN